MINLNKPGFKKVDMHIHTPASMCYSEKSTTTEEIVFAAIAAGLEAIAVTDHNTAARIEDIRSFASRNGLAVFPGIEISSRGGHVIALFELDTPIKRLEEFLDSAGIPPDGRGNAANMTEDGTEEVFQRIERCGGIAIAAHIERWPSGFLETNQPRQVKMKIHDSHYLSALEITIPQNRSLWNRGEVRGYPKKYACIQGSDAHAPGEIGRRPVYIQMDRIGLAGLRAAFMDYENRITFPEDYTPVNNHP
ncbi:MAG: PHP domain-containing protein [Dehalococcoidales bacterium]|nr:MAG: PHP domain-containing protein [Dehalococcoidales bacterium]